MCNKYNKNIFKGEGSTEILKTFGFITKIAEYQKMYHKIYDWRKHKSRIYEKEKYRWNKKLFRWTDKLKLTDE